MFGLSTSYYDSRQDTLLKSATCMCMLYIHRCIYTYKKGWLEKSLKTVDVGWEDTFPSSQPTEEKSVDNWNDDDNNNSDDDDNMPKLIRLWPQHVSIMLSLTSRCSLSWGMSSRVEKGHKWPCHSQECQVSPSHRGHAGHGRRVAGIPAPRPEPFLGRIQF